MDPQSQKKSNTKPNQKSKSKSKSVSSKIKPMDVSSDNQGGYCNGVECFVL